MSLSLHQEDTRVDILKVEEDYRFGFVEALPNPLSEYFKSNKRTAQDQSLRDFVMGREPEFDFVDAETVLSGEKTEVTSFSTDSYVDETGTYSVYGEVSRPGSDKHISSAVVMPGSDSIQEARERFRDYACASELETEN